MRRAAVSRPCLAASCFPDSFQLSLIDPSPLCGQTTTGSRWEAFFGDCGSHGAGAENATSELEQPLPATTGSHSISGFLQKSCLIEAQCQLSVHSSKVKMHPPPYFRETRVNLMCKGSSHFLTPKPPSSPLSTPTCIPWPLCLPFVSVPSAHGSLCFTLFTITTERPKLQELDIGLQDSPRPLGGICLFPQIGQHPSDCPVP